ncbi:MAG: tRNA (guanosine(37)-N1)-methyltransferase TrmD [Candidatus Yonathbacteria bacterium CG_4_10_14_3_um_filter_47_65]|uniref:tRNA (guanine-N(1)-)-methyltransferase n=2 Tax=Parcubacteria group TaxID=1794811 RepID=A0A2M8D6G0_9BACT|nr:MAG: tRNA (guanosine(37)-N1)-methyltransferase TrmD [Candidatus Nomurabacteria bacterium CG1_02_47_685]PIP04031.1 MAG: tRNA (guanosine(37)-N1)-methyltransferase TrmD [Candidatus Yonathbacteria bacterium CG23_combo_of_CG06-09_8_20_14_all_46_18]PIQ32216.1 MAG: tRNA (guanosine(37)-N1)-methyltransferase TrmD [Candidatus Yonathbacteria bacterium CG17_big_fil_post_rev_8_21_14_2_50_46_19]PIX56679.1 MAG: tRNA (guanosine(37)-N1)-methyltransferase TrmD [Candidatus Yonathbacteria bacterium CG_4_10_14_3_
MTFHVITLFPESIRGYLNESILGRAGEAGLVDVRFYNPRDFTKNKHRKVDDRPYGGGPGMVMQAEPIIAAVGKARARKRNVKIVLFSPSGKQFTNAYADKLAKEYRDIVLISGRYEGIDARVKKILRAEEVSIGPYVLTGGEAPAMVVVDAVSRRVPGVLGKSESIEEYRVSASETYTRPDIFVHKGKKYRVPRVLLSGDHVKIEGWKKKRKGQGRR